MTRQLIVRLSGQENGNILWLEWDNESNRTLDHGVLDHAAQLAELTSRASGAKVTVLVSSTEVGFHQLELPPGSRRHLAQIVPYALEEEVAEDIQALHFAWPAAGTKNKEDSLPVLIVARRQLDTWQQWLDDAGLEYDAIYPDMFILPLAEDEWSALSIDDDVVVRHERWRGFAIEQTLFAELAGLFSDALAPPQRIRCWGQVDWPQAPAELTIAEQRHHVLALARHLEPAQAINLLQGEYAKRRKRSGSIQLWRWPAIAAGVLLALLFLDRGITLYQLEREQARLVSATEQQYRDAFPAETRVVNVRAQLNQHLNRLQSGGSSGQLLTLLQQLAPAFSATELEVTLLQFDASRNELRIQASGADFMMFERFTQLAREQNLDVEQGQLNSRSGRIAGTLVVRGQS